MIRGSGFYQVYDQDGNIRTTAPYDHCKQWIKAQQGMDALTGRRIKYSIKKKKF